MYPGDRDAGLVTGRSLINYELACTILSLIWEPRILPFRIRRNGSLDFFFGPRSLSLSTLASSDELSVVLLSSGRDCFRFGLARVLFLSLR